MFLKQLNLTNFRNYPALSLDFDQRPTVLVGNNAAGKSNLLEAIYLLSTSKSLRVENEDELILDEAEFLKIEGVLENPDSELLIIVNRTSGEVKFRKKLLVNGIGKRGVDFIGNLPAIIFYPTDINMVIGSPALRRWHLDLALAQVDVDYKRSLTAYEQFLTARNRVLKRIREGQGKLDELDYWTAELIKMAGHLTAKREEFFNFINTLDTPLGSFEFKYQESEISLEKLKETNGREVAAAATLIGPHRDDFSIFLDDRNMAHFGSRGEQRTATLAFKFAALEYMAKLLGRRPLLLLDDIFSELDEVHRAHVAEVVGRQQTVIATVDLDHLPQDFLNSARILRVEKGEVTS